MSAGGSGATAENRSRRSPEQPWRPTARDLESARSKTVRDLIASGLRVLFVGINPGLYSAAVSHHFARPGNRFWPALHLAGITDRVLSPFEERELLAVGYGITNIVERATVAANALSKAELIAGRQRLERTVRRHRPQVVAFLGLGAYRTAFGRKHAAVGPQIERLGDASVWALPNPSGLNAHYGLAELGRLFARLHQPADS